MDGASTDMGSLPFLRDLEERVLSREKKDSFQRLRQELVAQDVPFETLVEAIAAALHECSDETRRPVLSLLCQAIEESISQNKQLSMNHVNLILSTLEKLLVPEKGEERAAAKIASLLISAHERCEGESEVLGSDRATLVTEEVRKFFFHGLRRGGSALHLSQVASTVYLPLFTSARTQLSAIDVLQALVEVQAHAAAESYLRSLQSILPRDEQVKCGSFLINSLWESGQDRNAVRLMKDFSLQEEYPDLETQSHLRTVQRLVRHGKVFLAVQYAGSSPVLQRELLQALRNAGLAEEHNEFAGEFGLVDEFPLMDESQQPRGNYLEFPPNTQIFEGLEEDLEAFRAITGSATALTLDAEWRAGDSLGVALVQIGIRRANEEDAVLLLDAARLRGDAALQQHISDALAVPLHNEAVPLYSFGLAGDLKEIRRSFPSMSCWQNVNGVVEMARGKESLSRLCERVLGLGLDKSCQMSDWERRPLTKRQRVYASLDALVLFWLADRIDEVFDRLPASSRDSSSVSTDEPDPHLWTIEEVRARLTNDGIPHKYGPLPTNAVAIKTLFFLVGENKYILAAVRESDRVDRSMLSHIVGVRRKHLRFASPQDCIRVLGFQSGSIPPLVLGDAAVQVILDAALVRDNRDATLVRTASGDAGITVRCQDLCHACLCTAHVSPISQLQASTVDSTVAREVSEGCALAGALDCDLSRGIAIASGSHIFNAQQASSSPVDESKQCSSDVLCSQQLDNSSEVEPRCDKSSRAASGRPASTQTHTSSPTVPCRFACDAALSRLAKWLRCIGVDVIVVDASKIRDASRTAVDEERIVLTRQSQLIAQRGLHTCMLLSSDDPHEQLREVVRHFAIQVSFEAVYTRCSQCNSSKFEQVSKEKARDLGVPPLALQNASAFHRCSGCEKVFWKGPKYERAHAMIRDVLSDIIHQ